MKNIPTIAIIGGGAAGLMAAATIIESGINTQISIFDKNNHLGAKVIISGGGRCNVTTGVTDVKKVLQKYTRGYDFLQAAISKFTPQACYEWFESHGVPLKTENDLRVFPKSNEGKDIVGIFETILKSPAVAIHLNTSISKIKRVNEKYQVSYGKKEKDFDYIVITTGGSAHRETGSTGDGYAFAQSLGHTITPLGPSLNSFEVKEQWLPALSGIQFNNAKLVVLEPKIEVTGPFLFTHFGISGPVTFSLSSHLSFTDISKEKPLTISIIPNADWKFSNWDSSLIADIKDSPKKNIRTVLNKYFPQRFVDTILHLTNIPADKKVSEISKEERQKISHILSGKLQVTLTQRRHGDEFVTAGGVDTNEISKQTLESTIFPKLFFAGEVMNIDGVTGGFNLHAAWSTGKLVGNSIVKKIRKG